MKDNLIVKRIIIFAFFCAFFFSSYLSFFFSSSDVQDSSSAVCQQELCFGRNSLRVNCSEAREIIGMTSR